MGYINGKTILPAELLAKIQEYIDGEYVYIPRKESNRKCWGENKNTRNKNAERNKEIYLKYVSGISVDEISKEYFLSNKTIYSILSKFKKY